jgi:transposase
MENCSVITWLKNMGLSSVFVNVRNYSTSWDSAAESHGQSFLRLILRAKSNIKKLRRLVKRSDLDLWFEDECHFQQHGSRCTMWVPPEDIDPIVLHEPTRKSVGIFGAVCATDGRLTTARADRFCAETFLDFLKQLFRRRRKDQKMVVVLDNARWHHAKAIQPWIKEHRKYLRLDFLPPYSPELNCIERVWKLTRRLRTHNRYFPRLEKLVEAVFDQFASWQKPNEVLRRLYAIA